MSRYDRKGRSCMHGAGRSWPKDPPLETESGFVNTNCGEIPKSHSPTIPEPFPKTIPYHECLDPAIPTGPCFQEKT